MVLISYVVLKNFIPSEGVNWQLPCEAQDACVCVCVLDYSAEFTDILSTVKFGVRKLSRYARFVKINNCV